MAQLTSSQYWAGVFIRIISLIILTILLIVHIITLHKYFQNQHKKPPKIIKVLYACNYLAIIFFILSTLVNLLDEYSLIQDCNFSVIITALTYHCAKGFLYCIFMLRLYVSFQASTHQYKNYLLYILMIAMIIYFGLAFGGDSTTISGTKQMYPVPHCTGNYPNWGVILFLTVDITISIICLVVYINPLRRLLNAGNTDSEKNKNVLNGMIKYTLITYTSIFSTFFAVIIVLTTPLKWIISLDHILNVLCIMLMASPYTRYYLIFFGCCHKRILQSNNLQSYMFSLSNDKATTLHSNVSAETNTSKSHSNNKNFSNKNNSNNDNNNNNNNNNNDNNNNNNNNNNKTIITPNTPSTNNAMEMQITNSIRFEVEELRAQNIPITPLQDNTMNFTSINIPDTSNVLNTFNTPNTPSTPNSPNPLDKNFNIS